MAETWLFDAGNPYEDIFEEALLEEMSSRHVTEILQRKLIDIRQDPLRQEHALVGGRMIFIARTGELAIGDVQVPPLLIAYTVDESKRIIQLILVRRDGGVRSLDDEVERALASPQASDQPERRILFPADPTSIREEKIAEAVRGVLRPAKQR